MDQMSDESFHDTPLMRAVSAALRSHDLLRGRYFTTLEGGRMTVKAFCRSQQQFFFAVRFFSRPMAALAARMPTSAQRQGLVHNLAEEQGWDDEREAHHACDPMLAHDHTMMAFLQTLGVSQAEQAVQREGAAVRAFNLGLIGACMMEPTDLAFACIGMIEYAFADVSAIIGREVVARGWISPQELVHYKLHAEIDKRHAADFFQMVQPSWEAGGATRAMLEDGMALGLHLFHRLYEDLYDGAHLSESV
jgi:pyrroloquinoline-quinone synthase